MTKSTRYFARVCTIPDGTDSHVERDWPGHRAQLFLLRGGGMNRYRLVHSTEFLYDGAVSESYNEVRLRPIDDETQSCLSFRLVTSPPSRGASFRDAYGNWIHQFNILADHRRLKIEAESSYLAHQALIPEAGGVTLAGLDAVRAELFEENYDFVAPSAYVPYLPELRDILDEVEELTAMARRWASHRRLPLTFTSILPM